MGFARVVCFCSRLGRVIIRHRIITALQRPSVVRIIGLVFVIALLGAGLTSVLRRLLYQTQIGYTAIGTDEHRSVLRLFTSDVSLQRIETLVPCPSCSATSGPANDAIKSLVATFVLLDGVKGFPPIQEIPEKDWPSNGPFIDCRASYDHSVVVVYRSVEEVIQDKTWLHRLLFSSSEECSSKRVNLTTWIATISSTRNFASAVNDILIEAYFDNVTWFDVFVWSDGVLGTRFRKWTSDPAILLAETQNIGVVEQQETEDGLCHAHVFFHKSHYEIFGHFFPLTNWTLTSSILHLLELYASQGLLRSQLRSNDSRPRPTMDAEPPLCNSSRPVGAVNDPVDHSNYDGNQSTDLLALDKQVLKRYLAALTSSNRCLRCHLLNRRSDVGRVIAMSLYGDDPKYTLGAVRNAQLLPVIFPGWRLWIYCEKKKRPPHTESPGIQVGNEEGCASIPAPVTHRLLELGAEVKPTQRDGGVAPMLWRFLPVDDASVDVFISRDSDSRLSDRDFAVVSAWLDTDSMFHCVRDHPSHASYPVSGGLWGARTKWLRLVLGGGGSVSQLMKRYTDAYMEDMSFLNTDLWPVVQPFAYCHDSVSCDRWPRAKPFPVSRRALEHIGQVFDEHSRPRQSDLDILMAAQRNPMCEPERA